MQEIVIDKTKIGDAKELVILLHELGYNFTEQIIVEKILTYSKIPNDKLFTAKINDKICGFLAFNFDNSFAKGPIGKIDTLVVKQEYRNLGIGKKLVTHAQDYAKQLGCTAVHVLSSNHRIAAHKFYEKLDYCQDSKIFIKYLN